MKFLSRETWRSVLEECSGYVLQHNIDRLIDKLCDILIGKIQDEGGKRTEKDVDEKKTRKYSRTIIIRERNFERIIQMIRQLICPHSLQRTYAKVWDQQFSRLLSTCIIPCNHPESWTRIIKTIINDDMNLTSPYDGSTGIVQHLLELIQRLYTAVAFNDRITIQNILRTTEGKYSLLHVIDELGWNLLHHAAYHGVSNIIEILVSSGLSLNEPTLRGETPLHIAAASMRFDSIQTLRELGASLTSPNNCQSPLQVFVDGLRFSTWTTKLSPQQVAQCIQLLSSSSFDIWNMVSLDIFSNATFHGEICELKSFSLAEEDSPSLFSVTIAYTDGAVSSSVLRVAEHSFQSLRHSILSAIEFQTAEETMLFQNQLKLYEHMIHTIQRTILLLIRKRKSRTLKLLLEKFWDCLSIGSTDPLQRYVSPDIGSHIRCISNVHQRNAIQLPLTAHESMKMSLSFWSQCLLTATSSNSLRTVGLLMNAFVSSLYSLFNHFIHDLQCNYVAPSLEMDLIPAEKISSTDVQRFAEILDYLSLREPFLLIPIFRADTSMLVYLMDMSLSFDNHEENEYQSYQSFLRHCLFAAWLTSPSDNYLSALPSLCIPSLTDSIFRLHSPSLTCNPISSFLEWCQQSSSTRTLTSLCPIATNVMSPLVAACLTGNTYILQILLQRCVFSIKFDCKSHSNLNQSFESLFTGLNPLCACLFSGSASTMRCMFHYLGSDLFGFLCNYTSASSPNVPLQLFLSILNVKRKRSFLFNQDFSQHHADPSLYIQIMNSYDDIHYSHSKDVLEILNMLLTNTDLDSMKTLLAPTIFETDFFHHRGEQFSSFLETVESPQTMFSSWEHLRTIINSVPFITKLKVMIRNLFTEPQTSYLLGTGVPELKTNRHYSNIIQAVVLLFQYRDDLRQQEQEITTNFMKQMDPPKNRSKDWWRLFLGYVNDDFSLPLKSFYDSIGFLTEEPYSNPKLGSKIANILLDFKSIRLSDEVANKVIELLPVSRVNPSSDLIPIPDLFKSSFQELFGVGILKRKCNNSIELSAVCEVIDTLYKWLLVILHQHQNVKCPQGKSCVEEISRMNEFAFMEASTPGGIFHLILGEYFIPIEIHATVCLFDAVLKEMMYQGHLGIENQSPCRFNNWSDHSSSEDTLENGENSHSSSLRKTLVHKKINYASVIDELLVILLHFFPSPSWADSISHVQGISPLILLCQYDCWSAAELLVHKLFTDVSADVHENHKVLVDKYTHQAMILFPGGLRTFSKLSSTESTFSSYSSIQHNKQRQQALYQYLHYPVEASVVQTLKYCDVFSLAILKRQNSFVLRVLPTLLRYIDGVEELMRLAYYTDNSILCTQLGWHSLGNISSLHRSPKTLYFYPSDGRHGDMQLTNHIPSVLNSCPSLPAVVASDAWNKRRLSGFYQNSVQMKKIIRNRVLAEKCGRVDPELLARVVLTLTSQNIVENRSVLEYFDEVIVTPLSSDHRTPVQKYQQQILAKYGCIPQMTGDYRGLCLSRDQSVWLMNGSLISLDDFFLNTSYLRKLLPAPDSPNSSLTAQYTLLHSLIQTSNENQSVKGHMLTNPLLTEMQPQYWETILHGWAICGKLGSFVEWPLFTDCEDLKNSSFLNTHALHKDALGRSSVYLSITYQSIETCVSLLKSTDTHGPISRLQSAVGPGKIAQKYINHSKEHVRYVEESFNGLLKGSYVGNRHGSLIYTLITYLDRLEMLYYHILNECDMTAYTRMIYDPVGKMVDCLQKSKSCLMLLNIPYSFFTARKLTGNQENQDGNSAHEIIEDSASSGLSRFPFHNLTPQKLRDLYPWGLICQVRSVLEEWIEEKIRAQEYFQQTTRRTKSGENQLSSRVGGASFLLKLSITLRITHLLNQSFSEYLPTHEYPLPKGESKGYLWESHVPPFLLAETRIYRKQQNITSSNNSEVVASLSKLLMMTKQNQSLIQNSLKTSIVLLEFIRTLCNARVLVSLTTDAHRISSDVADSTTMDNMNSSVPSNHLPKLSSKKNSKSFPLLDTQGSVSHPLDLARKEIKKSREHAHRVEQFLKSFGSTVDEMERGIYDEFLGSGAHTRIKLLDSVESSHFNLFFDVDPMLSLTFTSLRSVLLSCIYIILKIKYYQQPRNEQLRNTICKLRTYIRSSKFSEDELLFGQMQAEEDDLSIQYPDDLSTNTDDDLKIPSSNSGMHSTLANLTYNYLRDLRINDIAFVNIPSHTNDPSAAKAWRTHSELIMILYNYLVKYRNIFQCIPQIPLQCLTEGSESVPITNCPSQPEITDILNVFSYKLSQPELFQSAKEEIRSHVKSLRCAYSLAHILVEYIMTVIGIHSMSDIVVATDPRSWKGRNHYNPVISLCYTPLITTAVPEYIFQRVKYEERQGTYYSLKNFGFEHPFVECFELLIQHPDIVNQLMEPLSRSSNSLFHSYSQLDYFIFVCAIFGRPYLLEKALAHRARSNPTCFTDNHSLLWCVALLAPGYNSFCDLKGSDERNVLGLNLEQLSPHGRYEFVLLMLLQNGYDCSSPPSSCLTILDILSLKRYYRVIRSLHRQKMTGDIMKSFPAFGALQLMILDQNIPSDLFNGIIYSQKVPSEFAIDEPLNFSNFFLGLSQDIIVLGDIVSAILEDIKISRQACRLDERTTPIFPQNPFDDFVNSELLTSLRWNPSRLLQEAMKSLSSFHHMHCCAQSTASLQSPLASFFSRLEENALHTLRSNIDITPDIALQGVPMSSITWNTLLLVIAATSFGSQHSTTKFLTIWRIWTRSQFSQSSSDLLHFMCYYGFAEGVQHFWKAYQHDTVSLSPFTHRVFFSPLGNSLNPFEICLLVGANACLEVILEIYRDLKNRENNLPEMSTFFDLSSLLNVISTGKGGERMALTLLQLFLDVSTPRGTGKSQSQRYHDMLEHLCSPIDATTLPSRGASIQETIIHLAVRRNYIQLIHRLLTIGVNPVTLLRNDETAPSTPLEMSIALGHREITKLLKPFYPREMKAAMVLCRVFFRNMLKKRGQRRRAEERR